MNKKAFSMNTLIATAAATTAIASLAVLVPEVAHAGGLECRKVVSRTVSGEGRNPLKASRVKCGPDEFLTGGACYPEVRPEADGSCQTSAMGIIQTLADWPQSTRGAFYTCMQTGGTDCPVEERTRAMAICCKFVDDSKGEKSKDD